VTFFAAPEIISNKHDYDGKMVDVWSAGVMLYVMLFCHYPFEPPPETEPGRKMQVTYASR
jgi:serine/threonine-protein kinase SRK2